MKPTPPPINPDELEAYYGHFFEEGDRIRREHVGRFNYNFSACHINIGKYKLFELFPIKGAAEAEHSFLSIDKNEGVLVPEPFYKHRLKIKAITPPPPKRSPASFQPAPAKKVEPHTEKRRREEPRRTLPQDKDKAAAMDRWAI